jgi:hypothetical protein
MHGELHALVRADVSGIYKRAHDGSRFCHERIRFARSALASLLIRFVST